MARGVRPLGRADRDGRLGATDLEALAQAAWFTSQPDLAVEAKERAFKAYIAAGNKARAAKIAFELSPEYVSKLKFSIASAWAARGERLLGGEPEGFAHGYQALSKSITAEHAGDVETAIKFAGQAVEIGTRFSDADIRAWGLLQQGQLLIAGGRSNEGIPSGGGHHCRRERDPSWLGLQRQGCSRRRQDRRPRPRWGDPGLRSDGRAGGSYPTTESRAVSLKGVSERRR